MRLPRWYERHLLKLLGFKRCATKGCNRWGKEGNGLTKTVTTHRDEEILICDECLARLRRIILRD